MSVTNAEIPAEAFAQMPFLRRLNLDDNRLGSLPEFQLPPSLEILSVKGSFQLVSMPSHSIHQRLCFV